MNHGDLADMDLQLNEALAGLRALETHLQALGTRRALLEDQLGALEAPTGPAIVLSAVREQQERVEKEVHTLIADVERLQQKVSGGR